MLYVVSMYVVCGMYGICHIWYIRYMVYAVYTYIYRYIRVVYVHQHVVCVHAVCVICGMYIHVGTCMYATNV